MADDERRTAHGQRARPLNHPVYLSLLAGAGLTLAMVSTMFFSWVAAALGALIFLWGAGRWTWTMRDDFASLIADADRPLDSDSQAEH